MAEHADVIVEEVKVAFFKMWNELKRNKDEFGRHKVALFLIKMIDATRISMPEMMEMCKASNDILPKQYSQFLTMAFKRDRHSAPIASEDDSDVNLTESKKSKNVKITTKSKVVTVKSHQRVKKASKSNLANTLTSSSSDESDSETSIVNARKRGKMQSQSTRMSQKSDEKRGVILNSAKPTKLILSPKDSTDEETNHQPIGAVTKNIMNEVLNSGVIKPADGQFQIHVGTERVDKALGIPKSVAMLMGGVDSSDGSSTSEDSDFEAKRAPILKPKHKILPHVKRLNGARPLDKEKTKGIGTNCTKYNPYTKPRLNKKNLNPAQLAEACPYLCENLWCLDRFVSQRTLDRHSDICGKNRVFKCDNCKLRFAKKTNLNAHRKECRNIE